MPVSRRRYKRDVNDLRARLSTITSQRDEEHAAASTEREARRIIAGHFLDADAAARRTAERNRLLTELLEQARETRGYDTEEFDQLLARLERALHGCARYMAELGRQRRENTRLKVMLRAGDELCANLTKRLCELQKANEEQALELRAANDQTAGLHWPNDKETIAP